LNNSKKRGKRKPEIAGWPPLYLSPVPDADLKRSYGDHVVEFAEMLCKITEDSIAGSAGEALVFREWQKELTRHLFAVKADGTRRFRRALIGLPRKNGKSAWLSSVALESLMFGVQGGQIFSCAAEKEQAKIVFNTAKRMVEMEPELSEVLNPYKDSIYNPANGTTYRALSAESYSKEGLNPTLVAMDELHAHLNRSLYDVMSLAMGARLEPLLVSITTAGVKTDSSGNDSICYQLYNYGKKIAAGEVQDDSFFFAWWGADPNDDYTSEETWKKANPGYDDIVAGADFRSALASSPESEFRTKRLNQWVSTMDTWLPQGAFDAVADPEREVADHTDIVIGFDGSFNGDCTTLIGCSVEAMPHIFPIETWEKPDDADASWQVPILEVEDSIRNAFKKYHVLEMACDPYRWARTMQVLEDEGFEQVVAFPQNATRMTPATTRMFEAIVNKAMTHNGDPQLARHFGNASLKVDQRGTRLSKDKKGSLRRIDLAVASVMALERACWWFSEGSSVPKILDPWDMENE